MDSEFTIEPSMLSNRRALNKVSTPGDSPIQKFYKGSTVLVTGGSGFLGKLLIEKLLRTCSPKKIYVLIRYKMDKSPKERLFEILKDPLFEELRRHQKSFNGLIFPVQGDISELKMGLMDCDWKMISEEVNVIFHLAANVRFDLDLKAALLCNSRGTREALFFADNCSQLQAFVYVSTAYSHATSDRVDGTVSEIFYDMPVPPDAMIKLAETMSSENLNKIKSTIIEGWPNTYTFSKAIAEEIIRSNVTRLPICVVRPAIVIGTYREPTPGWLNMSCAYGPSGLVLGLGLGVIHVVYTDLRMQADLVPADIVNNSIIVAAYETAKKKNNNDQLPVIYTVSSNRNKITYSILRNLLNTHKKTVATSKAIWYIFNFTTKHKLLYNIMSTFFHYIPAIIMDELCILLRKPRMFVNMYKKVDKLTFAVSYFTKSQWTFKDDNLQILHKDQSPIDKKIFNMDIMGIDWHVQIYSWCLGIVKYLIKDDVELMLYAVRKQNVLRIIHYLVSAIYFYLMWKLIRFCFDLFCDFPQLFF